MAFVFEQHPGSGERFEKPCQMEHQQSLPILARGRCRRILGRGRCRSGLGRSSATGLSRMLGRGRINQC
eukprot:8881894-Heterocapsa_arctica.AAC.1